MKKSRYLSFILILVLVLTMFSSVSFSVSAYDTDYPNTWVNTGNQIEDLIGVATTQVGYHGVEYVTGTKYGAWFGNTLAPWCGMFVSWCASQAGIPESVILHSARAVAFKDSGTYHFKDGYTPKRGDLVLYNPTNSSGYYFPALGSDGKYSSASHVAIVADYDSSTDTMTLLHGNSDGDKVRMTKTTKNRTAIQCFVTPPYTSGSAVTHQSSYVNGSGVNFRASAGTSGSVITMLNFGAEVTVLDETYVGGDKWYYVSLNSSGTKGYIFGEYVTVIGEISSQKEAENSYVNASSVRMRTGAGTSYTVLGTYNYGEQLKVLDTEYDGDGDKWYKVKLVSNDTVGYIYAEYVTVVLPKEVKFYSAIDTPSNNKQVNISEPSFTVYGWAFSTGETTECSYSIDGKGKTSLSKTARPDVVSVYDDVCFDEDCGFVGTVDASGLSFGSHILEIFQGYDDVESSVGKVSFTLVDDIPPEGELHFPDKITNDGFTASVTASDNDGVKRVEFLITAFGKTDTTEVSELTEDKYVYTLNISDFTAINTDYTVTAYVTDIAGNRVKVGEFTFNPSNYGKHYVTFDTSGGNEYKEILTKTYGVELILPSFVPEKEGYIFLGWSVYDEAKSGTFFPEGVFTADEDTLLFAIWRDKNLPFVTADVNGDNSVDSKDLTRLKKHLSGQKVIILESADNNGDKNINAKDLTRLKKHLSGQTVEFI